MLYLLRSYGKDTSILKVGYAEDYSRRLVQYQSHNPYVEEVGKKDGDFIDETILHLYLHFKNFGILKDEWYKDCQEVIDIFNTPIDKLKEELWKDRGSVFKDSLSGKFQEEVYEHLSNMFDKEEVLEIDQAYEVIKKRSTKKELITRLNSVEESCLEEYEKILKNFFNIPKLQDRLKYLYSQNMSDDLARVVLDNIDDPNFSRYYWILGESRTKAFGYNKYYLDKEIIRVLNNQNVDADVVKEEIIKEFKVGDRYTKSDIKSRLGEVYNRLNYIKTPKASDLEEYFEIRLCQITNKTTGKRDMGFEIVKRKD